MTTTVLHTKIGEVENKIPEPCDLVTATILNIRIGEVENKIPDVSGLVTTTVLNTKVGEVEIKIPKFFLVKFFLVLVAFNICLFINQNLIS